MTGSVQQRISALEKKVGAQSKSPLFAQLAGFYLEAGRAKDALRVCDEGLANFPFFSTGHLIKGKALVALNMRAEARREFEWVHEFLPSNESIAKLLSEVPSGPEESVTVAVPEPAVQIAPPPVPQAPAVEAVVEEPPAAPVVEAPLEPAVAEEPPPALTFEPPPSAVEAPAPEPAASDFDFVGLQAPADAPVEPTPAQEPAATPEAAASPFDSPPTTPASDDIFGFGAASTPETPAEPQPAQEPAAAEPSPFGDFNFPSAEPTAAAEQPASSTPSAEEPAGVFDFPTAPAEPLAPTAPPVEEESFEQYATKMRGELRGENSLTLDEYLGGIKAETAAPESSVDSIEEITQKLQTAKKITPVINFAQKSTSTASEADTPSSSGFVTPTLAEIYAKQGWYDDAIKAYKTLIVTKPAEAERFKARITELEEMKNKG